MLSPEARDYYRHYVRDWRRIQTAAANAERLVVDALRDGDFALHQIVARAKAPHSLLRKIRRKGYTDPARQLTDYVAVRVITYYENRIDPIVERLSMTFEVDQDRSEDRRQALDVREFGYRSVHLVVRPRSGALEGSAGAILQDRWFEIQVRSILEHAWAEIEHEVVYKSGIEFPEGVLREFATMAAQLEALDERFLELSGSRDELIDHYKRNYSDGQDQDFSLDAARLIASLEVLRPSGYSFRSAATSGTSLPPHVEVDCTDALAMCGISTFRDLEAALATEGATGHIERYASLQQIPASEVSHFAVAVLVAGATEPAIIETFPDFFEDDRLVVVLAPEDEDDEAEGDEDTSK